MKMSKNKAIEGERTKTQHDKYFVILFSWLQDLYEKDANVQTVIRQVIKEREMQPILNAINL